MRRTISTPIATNRLQPIGSVASLWQYILEPQRPTLQATLEALGQSCAYIHVGRKVAARPQEPYGAHKERLPAVTYIPQWTLEEGSVGRWLKTSHPLTDDYDTDSHVFAANKAIQFLCGSRGGSDCCIYDPNHGASTIEVPQSQGLCVPSDTSTWAIVVQGTTICKMLAEMIKLLINAYNEELKLREAFSASKA